MTKNEKETENFQFLPNDFTNFRENDGEKNANTNDDRIKNHNMSPTKIYKKID